MLGWASIVTETNGSYWLINYKPKLTSNSYNNNKKNVINLPKAWQIGEIWMWSLKVDVPCDLLQCRKYFQLAWVHWLVPLTKSVILMNFLESIERRFQNLNRSFYYSTIPEAVDISRMDDCIGRSLTLFTARARTGNTFSVRGLL